MSESQTPTSEPTTPAPVRDRAPRPAGLFPRHLQTWFVAGVAGLIVLVVLLTGQQPPTRTPATAQKAPVPTTVDPNQVRIQEYRDRIDEQVRRLQAEQADLAATKQAFGKAAREPEVAAAAVSAGGPEGTAAAVQATLEQDKAQRAYRALYADNLAWTTRQKESGPLAKTDGRESSGTSGPTVPAASSGMAPALTSALAAAFAAAKGQAPPSPKLETPIQTEPAPSPTASSKSGGRPLADAPEPSGEDGTPTFPLLEGTIIEAVLTNRLDGSSAGPVNAMVTTPVYARDFQHVLIPAGSRVLGTSTPVSQFGQQRLAVAFHRLIFPNGRTVSLDSMPALNQRGDAGLRDQVDRHYFQIFGASLAIGALAGLAQINTGVGLAESWTDAYRQGVGSSLTQSSMRILDRFLNQLPTVTIREGHRLKVYLTADLALPEYRQKQADAPLRR
jgi:type IV secretory pathway VirB10-like protein